MKFNWNIPNILSLYRLLMFPVILYFAISKQELLFTWFICINLITDILDGFIARRFNMQTEFGARLDSIADIGTYILAFSGIFIFKSTELQPHYISLYIFLALFVICQTLPLFRWGRFPSFHLYSWKVGGYIQGIWFFTLFVFGFSEAYYYFMLTSGYLAFSEHLILQFMLKEPRSNLKGLYWVLKESKSKQP